jgi:hypothetical protein
MKCSVCASKASYQCSHCSQIYCGSMCQRADSRRCTLIGGRVKKNEERERHRLCRNEDDDDAITQEPFRDMDQRDIVVLDDTCFHLPSLYDWVINREQNRNPFTNLPFSEENLARLMEVATERHPLTLTIHTLQGNRVIQTTSLCRWGCYGKL